MLKKYTPLFLVVSAFIKAQDNSKEEIIWKNGIGKFENAEMVYYATKENDVWTNQYIKFLPENSYGAQCVSTTGAKVSMRLDPRLVEQTFEQCQNKFNE